MVNFGPLTAGIGFRVFASLLQRRRSSEANQTLHDVWPSPWAGTLVAEADSLDTFKQRLSRHQQF